MPICLLVRHGRTQANTSGILAGWTPGVGLDDTGRAQVEALAVRLQALPIRAVLSSPLQRCAETAAILTAGRDALTTMTDEALGECRYGSWTGTALKDLAKDPLWRVVQDQPSAARFPDGADYPGESLAEMQLRAVRAVRAFDQQVGTEHGPGSIWVAVSHGDVIKAILADAAGAHLDQFQRIVVDPASLSVVTYTSRRPFVVRTNDSGADLASLVPPPEAAQEAMPQDAAAGQAAGQAASGVAGQAASEVAGQAASEVGGQAASEVAGQAASEVGGQAAGEAAGEAASARQPACAAAGGAGHQAGGTAKSPSSDVAGGRSDGDSRPDLSLPGDAPVGGGAGGAG